MGLLYHTSKTCFKSGGKFINLQMNSIKNRCFILFVVIVLIISIGVGVGIRYFKNTQHQAKMEESQNQQMQNQLNQDNNLATSSEIIFKNEKLCKLVDYFPYIFLDKNNNERIANRYFCYFTSDDFKKDSVDDPSRVKTYVDITKGDYFMEISTKDGEESRFDDLRSINIAYRKDKALGYVTEENGNFCVIINSEKKGCYEQAVMEYPSSFSPDGKRFGYIVGRKYEGSFMVVDDKELGPYKAIGHFIEGYGYLDEDRIYFSPDSTTVVFVANNQIGQFLVINGQEKRVYGYISNPVFSSDSKKIAYVIREKNNEKDCLMINFNNENKENKMGCYDNIGGLKFSPDSKEIFYEVQLDGKTLRITEVVK